MDHKWEHRTPPTSKGHGRGRQQQHWSDRNGVICSIVIKEYICDWKGTMEGNDC